jgi:hypothetical protein
VQRRPEHLANFIGITIKQPRLFQCHDARSHRRAVLAPLTGFARYQRPLARGDGLRLNASRRVTGELGWDTIGERDIH